MITFVAPHAEPIEPRHRCVLAPCGRGLLGGATTRMGEGSARNPSPNSASSTSGVALSRKGRGQHPRRPDFLTPARVTAS